MQCLGAGTTHDIALPSETSEGPGLRLLSLLSLQLKFYVSELKVVLVSRMTGGVFSMQPLAQREKLY